MKILSLNIRHGGGKNAQALLDWTLSRDPDVVLLLEWRNNSGGRAMLDGLTTKGFATATACRQDPKSNKILIAARGSINSRRITPEASEGGELLLADLSIRIRVVAAYFPQEKWKEPFFRHCIAEATRASEVPILLIGDLNTGRNDLDIEGSGTRFHCADLFGALETQAGLIDLWRATPKNAKLREWSWRSRTNGFRIDHAFGNRLLVERFAPICCHYDHERRESRITDHSALLVELLGFEHSQYQRRT